METTTELLSQIIALGRQKGLRQQDIARRAGLQPESLSRAKKSGDMYVSNLQELARVVGLKLVLVPDQPVIEKIDKGTLFG
jgi:transcriptional regulator with XRE-family HTH domain